MVRTLMRAVCPDQRGIYMGVRMMSGNRKHGRHRKLKITLAAVGATFLVLFVLAGVFGNAKPAADQAKSPRADHATSQPASQPAKPKAPPAHKAQAPKAAAHKAAPQHKAAKPVTVDANHRAMAMVRAFNLAPNGGLPPNGDWSAFTMTLWSASDTATDQQLATLILAYRVDLLNHGGNAYDGQACTDLIQYARASYGYDVWPGG